MKVHSTLWNPFWVGPLCPGCAGFWGFACRRSEHTVLRQQGRRLVRTAVPVWGMDCTNNTLWKLASQEIWRRLSELDRLGTARKQGLFLQTLVKIFSV